MTAKKHAGFTLIESILYFGLFAVIAGADSRRPADHRDGGPLGGSRRCRRGGELPLAKIGWLLTGFDEAAGGVTSPATGESDVLEVRKPGIGVVRLEARGTDAVLTRANGRRTR